SLMAGDAIRLYRQVDSRRNRGPRSATIPRPRRDPCKRAHIQCGRNGCRVCGGEPIGDNCRHKNTRAAIERTNVSGRFGLYFGLACSAYLTWQGRMIEGKGVPPDVPVELAPDE